MALPHRVGLKMNTRRRSTRYMCRLIETIRFQEGQFNNLGYHEHRMRKALKEIYGTDGELKIETVLDKHPRPVSGLYKCRLTYDNNSSDIKFTSYTARPVNSLKLVFDDTISYPHKFSDRKRLENHFEQRGICDDVLIIKNGRVTDTTYANIVVRRGREWFTPSSFLLAGTMRQSLLDKKMIHEIDIKAEDMTDFESFRIINAMLMFDAPEVSIEHIMR